MKLWHWNVTHEAEMYVYFQKDYQKRGIRSQFCHICAKSFIQYNWNKWWKSQGPEAYSKAIHYQLYWKTFYKQTNRYIAIISRYSGKDAFAWISFFSFVFFGLHVEVRTPVLHDHTISRTQESSSLHVPQVCGAQLKPILLSVTCLSGLQHFSLKFAKSQC